MYLTSRKLIQNQLIRMKSAEIKFTVHMDENKLPLAIDWETSDGTEKSVCKSCFISMWDANEQNTLKIDLWTKDMGVEDMKLFFHQTLLSMANTFKKATGEVEITEDLLDYCAHFADKMGIQKPE